MDTNIKPSEGKTERELLQLAYDKLCQMFNAIYQDRSMGEAQNAMHGVFTIEDICRAANVPNGITRVMVSAYPLIHEINAHLKRV